MDPAADRNTYTAKQVDAVEMTITAALKKNRSGKGEFVEGPWCTFQACQVACPLKTKRIATLTPVGSALDLATTAKLLALLKSFDDWRGEAEERIHHELDHGVEVPGWKLVNKRAVRQWRDEADAIEKLRGAGMPPDKMFKQTVISPAQAEKIVKKDLVDKLSMSVSSGTTIALESDPRPATLALGALKKALGNNKKPV
jgi:hypothetical protein